MVRRLDGSVRYESRAEHGHTIEHINIKEKDRFMNGEKVRIVVYKVASIIHFKSTILSDDIMEKLSRVDQIPSISLSLSFSAGGYNL